MSDERRFTEEEVADIFRRAAEDHAATQKRGTRHDGLTLRELQQIGREVGVSPDCVARAAAAVAYTPPPEAPETYLGVPVGVAHTAYLPGPFGEQDWDRLVTDLRHTFGATGTVRQEGSLRTWQNGNLHARLEPAPDGHRLHLRTRKGDARPMLLMGLGFFTVGLALLVMMSLTGRVGLVDDTFIAAACALGGMALAGRSAYALPRWANRRRRQMEGVARRAAERVAAGDGEALGSTPKAAQPTPTSEPHAGRPGRMLSNS